MSKVAERALEWSAESIIGNIAWTAVSGFLIWFFNKETGCLAVIMQFAEEHGAEFAAWAVSVFLFGTVVGLLIRHRIALHQLDKMRTEYEAPARKMREKARGMSDAAKAVLAYCIDAPAPPMFKGIRDAGTVTRAMLEVRDSDLVKWNAVGGAAAVVTVLPEARGAITEDDALMGSLREKLPEYGGEILLHTFEAAAPGSDDGPADVPSVNPLQSPRDVIASNLSAGLSAAADGIDGVMRSAVEARGPRIPGFTQAETEMVLAILDKGSLYVGAERLPVAKALKSRGVIYRLDAPDSGVIDHCDVALTDEWREKVVEMTERGL